MKNQSLIALLRRAIGNRTLNGFCAEAGINAGNLSRILRGQKASADILYKISRHAQNGVLIEDLLYEAGYIKKPESKRILIYGTAAAGIPMLAYEEISGYIELNDLPQSAENYFALRVSGNSMDLAHIPNGCIAIAQKQQTLENGEIGVFIIDGDATIKQYTRSKQHIMLLPMSSDTSHQPQLYDETSRIDILGRVVRAVISI